MKIVDKYIKQFKRGVRTDSGESFWKLSDNHDEELKDLLFEIHKAVGFGTAVFPNDWIYQTTVEAFHALDDYSDWETMINEIEADVYYSDLDKWISDNGFASNWVNEAKENFGHSYFYDEIMQGQHLCKQEIYQAVVNFVNEKIVEDIQEEYN